MDTVANHNDQKRSEDDSLSPFPVAMVPAETRTHRRSPRNDSLATPLDWIAIAFGLALVVANALG